MIFPGTLLSILPLIPLGNGGRVKLSPICLFVRVITAVSILVSSRSVILISVLAMAIPVLFSV